jgi:5-methylcytosine-specific restriction endonuclease McrA
MPYKDPERRREYGREWIQRNAEAARQAMRRWRRNHRDQHNAERRAYHARHREERNAAIAAYHRANPDVRRTAWERRRARLLQAEGSYTTAELLELVARYRGQCAYCGGPGPLQADHRIPLGRGGTNYIENIIPACEPCNLRKHLLTEDAFRERFRRERLAPPPAPHREHEERSDEEHGKQA